MTAGTSGARAALPREIRRKVSSAPLLLAVTLIFSRSVLSGLGLIVVCVVVVVVNLV